MLQEAVPLMATVEYDPLDLALLCIQLQLRVCWLVWHEVQLWLLSSQELSDSLQSSASCTKLGFAVTTAWMFSGVLAVDGIFKPSNYRWSAIAFTFSLWRTTKLESGSSCGDLVPLRGFIGFAILTGTADMAGYRLSKLSCLEQFKENVSDGILHCGGGGLKFFHEDRRPKSYSAASSVVSGIDLNSFSAPTGPHQYTAPKMWNWNGSNCLLSD